MSELGVNDDGDGKYLVTVVVVVTTFSRSSLPISYKFSGNWMCEKYLLQISQKKILLTSRTSTYETGKIPFRAPIRPSYQFWSIRRVNETNSPFFNDSSISDCATKLYLARA